MRVSSYHHQPHMQRFLAGVALGGMISWLIFLFIFGSLQEKQTKLIDQQQEEIKELKHSISIWQEEFIAVNKKNKELLKVQDIKVKITNFQRYEIEDKHSIFLTEEAVKKDLQVLLAKDLEAVFKNRELLKKTIENKTIKINEKRYRFVVKELYFFTTIYVYLELRLAE
ncbi:MAG: sporulation protein [Bacillus sp. (in: Bacteria)]|jgi:hypothetical protein|nr:sporulation protein [Bacillus sp. (in: firmicutes)]